jgi:hypothetical protein
LREREVIKCRPARKDALASGGPVRLVSSRDDSRWVGGRFPKGLAKGKDEHALAAQLLAADNEALAGLPRHFAAGDELTASTQYFA